MPRGVLALALSLGLALAAARVARADEDHPPVYSRYERESIAAALLEKKAIIDPHPQGKKVEGIDTITLEVIEKRDPAPDFLNWFHVTTKHPVIQREVLQYPGERYDQMLIDETCRNLRAKPQLSLVLCLAVRGSRPDAVRILVVTKDIWSIRLNWNFAFADGKLQQLIIQPTETNVVGTHQVIAAPNFDLENDTISLGASYSNPRLYGTWISTAVNGGVILNRASGNPEGSFGGISYGQPLYSTRVEWAWGGAVAWRYEVTRRYVGGELAYYQIPSTPIGSPTIPWIYTSDLLSGVYSVTRSFGLRVKQNFELGMSASRNVFRVPADPNHPADPATLAQFITDEVPVSDTRIGPYLTYHIFENRYMSVLNFNALGLQEDVSLGFEGYLRLQPVLKALNSTRDFVASFAGAQYTMPFGDGLARYYAQAYVELGNTPVLLNGVPTGATSGSLPDETFTTGLRIETPTTPLGRLVLDSVLIARPHDYLNSQTTLGGSDRLRGYPSNEFIGRSAFAANFEFRTRPLEILTLQTAACAFFDVGDAFDEWNQIVVKRGIGAGLRMSLPQLNRAVFRLDWGFPLVLTSDVRSSWPGNFVVTFGQAFGLGATGP
jgi:hypothetical protein